MDTIDVTPVTIPAEPLVARITFDSDARDLIAAAVRTRHIAEVFEITSKDEAEAAAEELRAIKVLRTKLDGMRMAIAKPARQIIDTAQAIFKGPIDELDRADNTIRLRLTAWTTAEQRRQEAEQRAAEEAARKARQEAEAKAAAERAAAEAAAREKARQAAEALAAQRKAEEEGRAADAAKAAAEAAQRAQESQAALENGAAAAQATLITAAAAAAAPLPAAAPAAPAGTGLRDNWIAEWDVPAGAPTDAVKEAKLRLIRFVAANPQYENLLDRNDSASNKLAKALKDAMRVDGLRAKNEPILNVRKKGA